MIHNNKTSRHIADKELFALGRQLTIEYYDCAPSALLDPVEIEKIFLKAAHESHATVISSSFHHFEPQGVSGVVIIAESHFTVHAWPEHNYAAVDIFTCGDSIDLEKAVDSLAVSLGSNHVVVSSDRNRGLIPYGTRKKTVKKTITAPDLYPISWKREVEQKAPWGVLASVDLYECEKAFLEDQSGIGQFVRKMCSLMAPDSSNGGRRFTAPKGSADKSVNNSTDDCRITFFDQQGSISGFTMAQPSSTALVSGIISKKTNAAYIDLFSCNFFEPRKLAEEALAWFKASNYKLHLALRQ
ncbi:MAG: adenosylmethionine decarboxylase [Desulfobacterium sp.]|nr:adenosylmethionine decarboxylase [Desulfobacterium sp.]